VAGCWLLKCPAGRSGLEHHSTPLELNHGPDDPCTVTVSRLAVGSRQAGGSSSCGPGRALRTRRDRVSGPVKLPRGATKTAAAAADGAKAALSLSRALFSRPALSSRPGSCPRLRSASSSSARRPPAARPRVARFASSCRIRQPRRA
jgi:hypothetical protein